MPDLNPLKLKFSADSSSATASIRELTKALKDTQKAMGSFGTATNRATMGLRTSTNAVGRMRNSFQSLKGTIGSVKISTVALVAALRLLTKGIASCVKNSMDFVETMNLFNVSMGDNAIAAGRFAEKVQQAFGIDMAQWMRNQGVFQTLIEGFGVASEKADVMSQNLTQLGYDLSSLFNLPFAESMQKLQSGIAGELEPLRRLGFDLSQAKLQQIAYDHGIRQTVSTMTQAEKSQLRYYAIMTQVTTAHGDMARTILQPANMLRVFRENVTIAARAIGNLFIPAVQAALSVLIVLARGIAKVANAIAALFGINTDPFQYLDTDNYNTGGWDDTAEGIDDVGNAAGSAADKVKEFKKQFLGFDKINNITLPTEPSSGGGGGGGGDVGGGDFDLPLPTYDFLQGIEDAFAKAHPRLQKLFDDLAKDFENGGENIGRILGEAVRDALVDIDWDKIKKSGETIASKLADGLNDFLETPGLFKAVGSTLAETLNTVFNTANTFAEKFHWTSLGTAVSDTINAFFEKFDFKLAAKALSNWTKGMLDTAIAAVSGVDWEKVGKKIAEFISGIDFPEIAIKVAKLTVDIADAALNFGKGLSEGFYQAEMSIFFKPGDERTEAWTKLLLWLQQLLLAPTISAKLQILAEGPGVGFADLFGSKDPIEKDAKVNVMEGKLDPSLQKNGEARKTYDYYKEKKTKVGLKQGEVSKSLQSKGFARRTYDHFQRKNPKIGLSKGSVSGSLQAGGSTRKTYDYFKNKAANINVATVMDSNTKKLKELLDAKSSKKFNFTATGSTMTLTPMTQAQGGVYKNGKWRPITAAANGGAFNTGQMFIAREAGPELVGRIGSSTAVMNNNQIVSSVAAGVASAMSTQNSLLRQLVSAVQNGDQTIVLQVDSTKFGEVSIRSINQVQRQQGRTLLKV